MLLNARAIVKCKANLNTFSYPALFLFLEASCMRQIRQIFGLSTNEFAANSDGELANMLNMANSISVFDYFGPWRYKLEKLLYFTTFYIDLCNILKVPNDFTVCYIFIFIVVFICLICFCS